MSSGGAVLVVIMVCLTMISLTARRLHRELEPTVRSFERLHRDVTDAVRLVSRDTGRAQAGRRLLARNGNPPAPR
jgi:thiosulfate reductase cytochrome b subunit